MYGRPNPQVKTGPVDTNCPLILCDLTQLDTPIVYASEAFSALTGYSSSEVLGYNCRFIQSSPSTRARPVSPNRAKEDKAALKEIRRAVGHNRECQVQITNYRKDGTQFLNYLTIIPVRWNSSDFNYSVGLQQGVA
jgi:PAS domain S-box-containing protein